MIGTKQTLRLHFAREVTTIDIETKLKALKQNLEEDFQIFLGTFEDLWHQLERTTRVRDGNYFKLIRFMEVLHPKVREKCSVRSQPRMSMPWWKLEGEAGRSSRRWNNL